MKLKTHANCKTCGSEFRMFKTTDKYCSYDCAAKDSLNSNSKKSQQKSANRIRQNEYPKIAKKFKQENPNCEICGGIATDVHHKAGRIGELLNDVTKFMAVCRTCHGKIHNDPKTSREKGWLV